MGRSSRWSRWTPVASGVGRAHFRPECSGDPPPILNRSSSSLEIRLRRGRTMFRLRAFGGLTLERDGAPYVGPATQRRRLAVLAVLAASDAGVSRDRLVD